MIDSDVLSQAPSIRQDVELEAVQQQQIRVMDRMLDHVETLHAAQLQHTQIIEELKEQLGALRSWSVYGMRAFNHAQENGGQSEKSYVVIPLPDGGSPTAPPYDLPPISSLAMLRGMPIGHINTYLQLYGLDGDLPDSEEERRRRLAVHIGVKSSAIEAIWGH